MVRFASYIKAGVAQLAEHQPSKLRVAGSIPVSRSIVLIFRLTGLIARASSVCLQKAGMAASRRSFIPPSEAGVQLSWSTGLTQKSQKKSLRHSLGAVEWVKKIWLINFSIYLASLSYLRSAGVFHFFGPRSSVGGALPW